jgi:hypothetical protein
MTLHKIDDEHTNIFPLKLTLSFPFVHQCEETPSHRGKLDKTQELVSNQRGATLSNPRLKAKILSFLHFLSYPDGRLSKMVDDAATI